ncbi:MAG: mandelate racemase/muconate lactonizing enzyme family protein [Burkholderiales bacterium]|nr:mandelate racemase/muconate lactonizing enzyme family protein [Burkholderiales bacterium]
MNAAPLRRLALDACTVSGKTRWLFVSLEDADGRVGWGEATLQGAETAVAAALAGMADAVVRASPERPDAFAASIAPQALAEAAAASAVDQALWDLRARQTGMPLAAALGGARRDRLPVYANINRRTLVRTPEGFAASARDALAAGFRALKIAPFDEVDPARCARGEGGTAMRAGLARIAAVRAAAGPAIRLMVDCHWRFDEATAAALIDAVAGLELHWIECPLPENAANLGAIARLRSRANAGGIRLAGMEQGIGCAAFRPYCEAGAYDVMMPDVKYVGGLAEMLRVAGMLERHGVEMSPHNPSGPVAHMASVHVGAVMNGFDMLELQYDESPLFDALAFGNVPARVAGATAVPAAPGLGIGLDGALLAQHAASARRVWEAT